MFGPEMLDSAIAMILGYFLLSLVPSAINERIDRQLKSCAADLETAQTGLASSEIGCFHVDFPRP